MKILYIIHDFLPKHQAGAEIYTYLLAKELSGNHEICLFFTEIKSIGNQYTATRRKVDNLQCIEVFRPPEAQMAATPYIDKKMEDIFSDILHSFKPDIVHIQHLLYHSLTYPAIARHLNIPVFYSLHDYWLTCPRWGQRIQKDLRICHVVDLRQCGECRHEDPAQLEEFSLLAITQFIQNRIRNPRTLEQTHEALKKRISHVIALAENVNVFIAPSRFLQKEFMTFGIPEHKILFSDNGSYTHGYAGRKKPSGSILRFGFIGTISEHKGVHVLVEAFNSIPEKHAELHIYGDLSWFPRYSSMLRKAATSSAIQFMGPVPNTKIPDILAGIDVLVVPSIWFENSPITIHEAFLAGVPVITSNIGGMADLVSDRINGLHFQVNNSQSLAGAIKELIESRSLLERLRKGIPAVKSIEENGREMEQLYMQYLP